MKLRYVKDMSGDELLEDEDSQHQIMMEWEKPYMEKCIELLDPSGSVLEIGFGMGYSANKICSNINVTCYTIIECSPVVWDKIEEFKIKYSEIRPDLEIILLKGRWQDIIQTASIYNSIYFDDYIGMNKQEDFNRFNKFLYEVLENHSIIGTKIGLYSTINSVQKLDCIKTNVTEFKIDIPSYCKYARGDTMYIPVIEKISECEENIKEKLFINLNNCIKIPSIRTNIIVIDNFLTNPVETYNYAKQQDFEKSELYSGKRSKSFANNSIKNCIEKHLISTAGRILEFNLENNNLNFNGSYEYTNSYDNTSIKNGLECKTNNWCGVLFLYNSINSSSGIQFYTPTINPVDSKYKDIILEQYSQDMTKWIKQDYISNKYNRLVLFRSDQYYKCDNFFGTSDYDGRLVQLFFFTTEN
jgi:hypothetical protein